MRRISLLPLVTAVVVTLASGSAVHQLASSPAGAAPLERAAVVELAPDPPITTLQHSAVLASLPAPGPTADRANAGGPAPASPSAPAPAEAPRPPAPTPPATPEPAPAAEPAPVAQPPPVSEASAPADGTCEADLHRWTNDARSAQGVAPLAFDDVIVHVPRSWSEEMAAAAHLAHNPDHADEIWQVRPQARKVSENVGRGYDVRAVFDAFMGSPTHRANILDPSLAATAIGCVRDADGQAWVAVDFWG